LEPKEKQELEPKEQLGLLVLKEQLVSKDKRVFKAMMVL
jgi:hypothetical protein